MLTIRPINPKYSMHVYTGVFYAAQASFQPFLGVWFADRQLNSQQIGLLMSIGPIFGLFIQPLWGLLCDRFGLERTLLLLGTLATPLLAFGYRFAGGWYALYLATAFAIAAAYSAMAPISDAMTVRHARTYALSYGSIRVLGSISFALAVTPFGLLYKHSGLASMFPVYAVMSALLFLSCLQLKSPTRLQAKPALDAPGMRRLITRGPFPAFFALVFVVTLGASANNAFYSVWLSRLGGEVAERVGVLNTVSALSELPWFWLAGRIIGRFGTFPILALAGFAAAFRWFVLSLEPSFPVLLLNQLLHGITYALFLAAGVSFMHDRSPEGMKTTGQTLFAVVSGNLSALTASNAGGWVMDRFGFPVLFQLAACLSLAGAFGFLLLRRRWNKEDTWNPDNSG